MKKLSVVSFALGMVLSASSVLAASTSFEMSGPAGEYISQGQHYYFTPGDGSFTVTRNYDGGVSLYFHSATNVESWSLDLAAANNAALTVGSYEDAAGFPVWPNTIPSLSVWGDGRACNESCGSFDVLEATYANDGTVLTFWAIGLQACEVCTRAPLTFELQYNIEDATPTRPTTWGSIKSQYR